MLLLLFKSRRLVAPPQPPAPGGTQGGLLGPVPARDGGRRRRVLPRQLEPAWQAEHENDAVLIAAGIF